MQSKSSDLATEWDSTPKMQFSSTPVPSASSNFGIYLEETPSNTAMETSQKNGWSISELWRMQRSAIGEVLEESTNDEGHSATGNSMVSTCSQGFSPPLLETSQYSNVSFSSFLKLFADPENYPADFDHNSTGKNSQEGKYIEPNNLDARLYDLPPCSTSSIVPISIDELSEDIVSSSEHMVSNSQAPEDIHAMITGDSNSLPVMSPPCEKTRCTIDFDFESNFYSALNSLEPNAFEAPKALLPQFRSRKPITYYFGDEEENGICPETLLPQTTSAISAKMQCLDHNSLEEQRRMNLGNTNMSNVYPHKRNSTEALLGENHQPPRKSALLWSSANGYNNLQNSSLVTYDTSSSAPKTATRLPLNTNLRQRTKKGSASDPQSIAARHRRERISERLKILQDMVPNGSKVDLVTMLEKAINYVKFLQLQVQVLATDEYWPKHDMVPTIMKVEDAIQAIASAEANRFKAFSATNMDMSTTWKIPAEDPFNSCETSKSKFPC